MPRKNLDVYYDSGVEGWIKNTAREHSWRLKGWYSVEDLIQDGYLCYCKCRNRYTLALPAVGEGPDGYAYQNLFTDEPDEKQRKHFMALLQRTFFNHIMTLSSKFALCKENTLTELSTDDDPLELESLTPITQEESSVMVALLQAPTEIGDAIGKLLQDGLDGGRYIRSKLRNRDGRVVKVRRALRETSDQRLGRILGDPDMPYRVRQYVLSDNSDWEGRLEQALRVVLPSTL